MSGRRPIFRDGERLTAQRLNQAFGYVDDRSRRGQLGAHGPGVVHGYELSVDDSGPELRLRIGAGLAVDGAGRFLISAATHHVTIGDIEASTGPLPVGARVLVAVQGGEPARSSADPCAHLRPQVVVDAPVIRFEARAGAVLSGQRPLWSDLGGRTADELAVILGALTVVSDSGGFTVSMVERQGIAPRGDALENSFGHRVMELRDDGGNARVRLLASTYGDDVTATRIGIGGAGAASFAHSDSRVLLIGGGAGALPAGLGGLAAVPVELDSGGGSVDRAGVPLDLAEAVSGRVRVRRAGRQRSQLTAGVSAAPSYVDGDTTVVPVATAGLVEVRVRASSGIPLGAPLRSAGGDELEIADRGPSIVVARAAESHDGGSRVVTLHAWVCPAQPFTPPSPGPHVD